MKHLCATFLLLFACSNSFDVGPTTFIVLDGATPWDDLPEAVQLAQTVGPKKLWDTRVILEAAYKPIEYRLGACLCDGRGVIETRTKHDRTQDSCLFHEFAHRWEWVDGLPKDETHGPDFNRREFELLEPVILELGP